LDKANIDAALHDSLRRLRTDYIDLYQLHWPDRAVPQFGQRGLNGLSEYALREKVGLLAYSPLAAGHLSGKYLGGVTPAGSRFWFDTRSAGTGLCVSSAIRDQFDYRSDQPEAIVRRHCWQSGGFARGSRYLD